MQTGLHRRSSPDNGLHSQLEDTGLHCATASKLGPSPVYRIMAFTLQLSVGGHRPSFATASRLGYTSVLHRIVAFIATFSWRTPAFIVQQLLEWPSPGLHIVTLSWRPLALIVQQLLNSGLYRPSSPDNGPSHCNSQLEDTGLHCATAFRLAYTAG